MRRVIGIIVLSVIISLTGTLKAETEIRDVRSFEKISFRIDGTLLFSQSNNQEVKLIGSNEFLEHVIVEVENNTLIVRYPNERLLKNNDFGKIEIHVKAPIIEKMSVLGSGDLIVDGKIEVEDLNLNISGSGDIRLEKVNGKEIGVDLAGSGDVVFDGNGEVEELKINIFGSGDVVCPDLKSEEVDIKIFGSGDCHVYPVKELDVKIFGSGDVLYKGKPDDMHSSIFGSGDVKKMK